MRTRRAGAGLIALAAFVAATPAAAAPLAAGPLLDLSIGQIAGARDAAVTDAGDALIVISAFRTCCIDDATLLVRQRRGARGPFGAPVQVTTPGASPGGTFGGSVTTVGPRGDAVIAVARTGGLRVLVRRGWSGRWLDLSPPGAASLHSPALALSRGGRALDLLWFEDRASERVVRGARLVGATWTPSPDVALAPRGTFSDAAVAAGGKAVAVTTTAEGRIVASIRPGHDVAWEGPVELARMDLPTFGPTGVYVDAATGRDGSLLVTWNGVPPGGDRSHAFVARRRPGAAAWDAPIDLGVGESDAAVDTNVAGALAAGWPESPSHSDEGPGPFVLRVAPAAGALGAPVTIRASGAAQLRIDDRGRAVMAAFAGLNVASSGATLLFQDRPGGPVRRTPWLIGDASAFAAGERSALLAGGSTNDGRGPHYVGVDGLGPLGLRAPATARAGGSIRVRLELWRRTRVTVRLLGGPARDVVTRTLPAGRSTVRLRLPARAGTYLVRAVGREPAGRPGLHQRALVRVR